MAYILYLPSKKLEGKLSKIKILKKRSRGLSVFIVYVLFFAIIAMLIAATCIVLGLTCST